MEGRETGATVGVAEGDHGEEPVPLFIVARRKRLPADAKHAPALSDRALSFVSRTFTRWREHSPVGSSEWFLRVGLEYVDNVLVRREITVFGSEIGRSERANGA